jgi:hypothetical protein
VFVETDDRTGLARRIEPIRLGGRLVPHMPSLDLDAAVAAGSVQMSGARAADVGRHLPLAGC